EPERAQQEADARGIRLHEDIGSLLEASDAVIIASTNADHRRYAEAAARAKVHVLSEKPLATTLADGRAMVEICRAAGVQLGSARRGSWTPSGRRSSTTTTAPARCGRWGGATT